MTEPAPTYTARPLAPNHAALLSYIIRYKETHGGDSPTVREIMGGVGYQTTSAVFHALSVLERHGRITRPFGRARSIAVTGGRWVYEPEGVNP